MDTRPTSIFRSRGAGGPARAPWYASVMLKQWMRRLRAAWSSPRWRRALVVAMVSDALGFGVALWPPAQWLLDATTALVLLVVLGFRWPLLSALVVEAIPALELFPAWTLVVAALAAADTTMVKPVVEEDS